MWRAALPCRRYRLALLCLTVAVAAIAAAPASTSSSAPKGQIWAIALPAGVSSAKPAQLSWLSTRGVTTVVVFGAPKKSLPRLAAAASRAKLNVIAPMKRVPRSACKSRTGSLRTCAAVAPTAVAAVKLARRSLVDYVLVRVSTPRQLRMLRGSGATRSRIVAILPLHQDTAGQAAWRAGVAYAAADPALDLGVSSPAKATNPLGGYLSQVPRTRAASAAGPAAPTALLVTGRSTSSVTLRWTAAVGPVAGYGIYTDNAFVLNVTAVSITVTGLKCGRSYTFGVDSFDVGGTRSGRISTPTSTTVCLAAGGGGGADALPPTAPLGLVKASSTQSSISVSWTSSSDNVGVAGYGVYRNASSVGSSTVTSYSFAGLVCGTTYLLGVDAHDAVGNRSGRTSISAATNACVGGGDTSAPSTPGALSKTGSTMTSISVAWGLSTDNIGVTGYGLYRNSTSTGSTNSASATFSGLTCGSSYTLAADAFDAAGNRSAKRSLTTSTSACPPSSDTQAPSVPQGMGFGATTETTVTLGWNASTDNVGVAGYRVFRNGVSVATVPTPGYTYTGLTCGTSYELALEAYDAAGNASNRAEATGSASTTACGGGPPPSPPSPPPGGGATIQPGQSWQSAYNAAAANSTLNVAAGNHGSQTLSGSKQVTFLGANGAVLGELSANASNITLDNVDIDGNSAKGTILRNSGDNNAYRNLEIREVTDVQMITNTGVLANYDNVFFHTAVMTTAGENAGVHMECMWSSGPNLIIRNSVFRDCSVMDLLITRGDWYGQPNYCCVVLENNIFYPSERINNGGVHYYSVFTHENADKIDRYQVRNNRFDLPFSLGGNPVVNSTFCGNTGQADIGWKAPC